jgi:hypothetical protein
VSRHFDAREACAVELESQINPQVVPQQSLAAQAHDEIEAGTGRLKRFEIPILISGGRPGGPVDGLGDGADKSTRFVFRRALSPKRDYAQEE